MIDLFQLIQDKKSEIKAIAKKHGAYDVRIFGSVARKNFDENSDIDFLVNFNSKTSLLDWCNLTHIPHPPNKNLKKLSVSGFKGSWYDFKILNFC